MTFSINAWLDRSNPFIELRNNKTGELMAHFTGERLRSCIEQGDICLRELCKADQATQQELVRCLLLTHCSQCLKGQLEGTAKQVTGGYLAETVDNIVPFKAVRRVFKV